MELYEGEISGNTVWSNAPSLTPFSNNQKSAVHGTMILVRLRGVYWGLFSDPGANLSSSQVASRLSVMVQQRT